MVAKVKSPLGQYNLPFAPSDGLQEVLVAKFVALIFGHTGIFLRNEDGFLGQVDY
jgi:hypothetical protein